MDIRILEKGLSILSQCKRRTGDIWEAHYGAAAIASYFFVKENKMSDETAARVAAECDLMLSSRSYVYVSEGELSANEATGLILHALWPTMDELHYVGHNVIYAAISLLAIKELGSWGHEDDIAGISSLIQSFQKTIPGRSWLGYSVSDVKRLELTEGDQFPNIQNPTQLSELVLKELASFQTIYKAEAHHDLIGHMLTFSQALNVLHDLGHDEYFRKGIPSLLKLIKVLRVSQAINPDHPLPLFSPIDRVPLPLANRSEWLPLEAEYWIKNFQQEDWDFGHAFKFPYSFYNHMNRLAAPHSRAEENLRYLVGS